MPWNYETISSVFLFWKRKEAAGKVAHINLSRSMGFSALRWTWRAPSFTCAHEPLPATYTHNFKKNINLKAGTIRVGGVPMTWNKYENGKESEFHTQVFRVSQYWKKKKANTLCDCSNKDSGALALALTSELHSAAKYKSSTSLRDSLFTLLHFAIWLMFYKLKGERGRPPKQQNFP